MSKKRLMNLLVDERLSDKVKRLAQSRQTTVTALVTDLLREEIEVEKVGEQLYFEKRRRQLDAKVRNRRARSNPRTPKEK